MGGIPQQGAGAGNPLQAMQAGAAGRGVMAAPPQQNQQPGGGLLSDAQYKAREMNGTLGQMAQAAGTGGTAPGAGTGIPEFTPTERKSTGIDEIMDNQAKASGFQSAKDRNKFLESLTKGQRASYNRPDIRQSGTSIMSPTDMPYNVQDPNLGHQEMLWKLKGQYPDLFADGGGKAQEPVDPQLSEAQRIAREMNARNMR